MFNNKGASLLFVLATLLITTFIGAALMTLARHDVISASDYNSMSTATITAKSSMQAAVAKFEKESQTTVNILNRYLKNPNQNWLLGDNNNPVTLNAQQKYTVKITGFDTSKFIVQLEGIGHGKGGSKKRVIGVYQLDGIGWASGPVNDPKPVSALYLGDGAGEINAPIYIHGDTYINNPRATFCDGSHNSHFDGVVKTGPGSIQLTVRGAVFHGPTYFRCPVLHNALSPIYMNGVGYEKDVTISGTNDPIVQGKGFWINGNYSTEFTGRIQMNGFAIWGWDNKSFIAASGGPNTLRGIATGENPVSDELDDSIVGIVDSLGIPEDPPPPFLINLDDARTYAIPVTSVANVPDGNDFNNKYYSMLSSQLFGGVFLVVKGRGTGWWAAEKGGTFTGKLIWILENEDPFRIDQPGIFECSADAVIFLYFNNTRIDNFRNVNRFNAFIYAENYNSNQHIFGGSTSHVYGGIHIKDGIYRREGDGTQGAFHIHYDANIINQLDAVGIFADTGTTMVQIDSLILTKPAITSIFKGMHF